MRYFWECLPPSLLHFTYLEYWFLICFPNESLDFLINTFYLVISSLDLKQEDIIHSSIIGLLFWLIHLGNHECLLRYQLFVTFDTLDIIIYVSELDICFFCFLLVRMITQPKLDWLLAFMVFLIVLVPTWPNLFLICCWYVIGFCVSVEIKPCGFFVWLLIKVCLYIRY